MIEYKGEVDILVMKKKAGDMIRVSRKNKDNYQYGLYIGDDEVVYYSEAPETKGEVIKTSLQGFKKRNGFAEAVDFPEPKNGRNSLVKIDVFKDINGLITEGTWPGWFTDQLEECVLNTIWETVTKAKSMVGKKEKFNNGEHFVWWCKVELKRADKKAKVLDELLNPSVLLPRFQLTKKS